MTDSDFNLYPSVLWTFYLPLPFSYPPCPQSLKELELYKQELVSKPALLVVNKMDLPDAQDKLQQLKEQLQNPDGKFKEWCYTVDILTHNSANKWKFS